MKILSIALIVIGSLLLLVGLLFNMMDAPDLFAGTISGPVFLIIGLGFMLYNRKKAK